TISSTSAKVTLSRMTITGGLTSRQVAGGGIINRGSLRLNAVYVTGNGAWSGGGIYKAGSLVIKNSTISRSHVHSIEKVSEGIPIVTPGFGGGISNSGTLSLNKSTISANAMSGTSLGAGISNTGTLVINNSTISENVLVNPPTRFLSHGGGLFNSGNVPISNSTIPNHGAQVGGNIYRSNGSVTLQNSIVAHNLSGGNCDGAIVSHGYNLSSDGTCTLNNTEI